jgi:hypothetical protein
MAIRPLLIVSGGPNSISPRQRKKAEDAGYVVVQVHNSASTHIAYPPIGSDQALLMAALRTLAAEHPTSTFFKELHERYAAADRK